jgi:hypothetical protein
VVSTGFATRDMAKRLRHTVENAPARNVVMQIVECFQCGQRFAISHSPASQDVQLAEKQATWLKDRLVWDHIQENKHPGSVLLPAVADIK